MLGPAAARGAPAKKKKKKKKKEYWNRVKEKRTKLRPHDSGDHYVFESEEVVLGESRPLSELLLVISAVSSAAAAMDISRSSSGIKYKNTQSD